MAKDFAETDRAYFEAGIQGTEFGAKDALVNKFVKAWENQTARRAVKGGTGLTMALTLAACGGGGDGGAAVTPTTPVTAPPPPAPEFDLTPANAAFAIDTNDLTPNETGAIINVANIAGDTYAAVQINLPGAVATGDKLTFNFGDNNAEDVVVLTATSDVSGYSVYEVVNGTVDFTALGDGVLANATLIVGSAAILTSDQVLTLSGVELREEAASGELQILLANGADAAAVAEKIAAATGVTVTVVAQDSLTVPEQAALEQAGATVTGENAGEVVRENSAPVAEAAAADAVEGAEALVEGTLAATDADADAVLTFALDAPVAGLTVNDDGTYSFDATDAAYNSLAEGETLEVVAAYTVTDDQGATSSSTLTITVTGTNDAPVIEITSELVTNEDTPLVIEGTTIDPEGDNFTETVTAENGTVVIDEVNGGATYTPNADFNGVDTVTYSADDGNGGVLTETFQITVNPVNDAPVAEAGVAAATEGDATAVTGQLVATDVDTGATQSFALDAPVAGLTVLADGSYSFDPTDAAYENLAAGETQDVVANYTVTDDEGATASSTLTITVTGTNDDPVAEAAVATATEGAVEPVTGQLVATDVDTGATQSFALDAPVAGLTVLADGSYSFDPTDAAYENLADGEPLDIVANYTVTDDQGATSSATLTITIGGVNQQPTISITPSNAESIAENTVAGAVVAQAVGGDVDTQDTLSYSITAGNDAGLFVIDAVTGEISLAQDAPSFEDGNTTYTLDVTVDDGSGTANATSVDTLTVEITDANDAPVISNKDVLPLVGAAATLVTAGASVADEDGVTGNWDGGTITVTSEPGFQLANGGNVSFAPAGQGQPVLVVLGNGELVLDPGTPGEAVIGTVTTSATTATVTFDATNVAITNSLVTDALQMLQIDGVETAAGALTEADITVTVSDADGASDSYTVLVDSDGVSEFADLGAADTRTENWSDVGVNSVALDSGANAALVNNGLELAGATFTIAAVNTLDTITVVQPGMNGLVAVNGRLILDDVVANGVEDNGETVIGTISGDGTNSVTITLNADALDVDVNNILQTTVVTVSDLGAHDFSVTLEEASGDTTVVTGVTITARATIEASDVGGAYTFDNAFDFGTQTLTLVNDDLGGLVVGISAAQADGQIVEGTLVGGEVLVVDLDAAPADLDLSSVDNSVDTLNATSSGSIDISAMSIGILDGIQVDDGVLTAGSYVVSMTAEQAAQLSIAGASTVTSATDDVSINVSGSSSVVGGLDIGGTSGDDIIVTNVSGPIVPPLGDIVNAGAGDDTVTGGIGDDFLVGGDGNDILNGGIGDDDLEGNAGLDILNGGAGNDFLVGGDGDDTLTGGAGDDTIDLGPDVDIDTVVFSAINGSDNIVGFVSGTDQLNLDAVLSDVVNISNVTSVVAGGAITSIDNGVYVFEDPDVAAFADIDEVAAYINSTMVNGDDGFGSSDTAAGEEAIFIVNDGVSSTIYHFVEDGNLTNATSQDPTQGPAVSGSELTLLATVDANVGAGDILTTNPVI